MLDWCIMLASGPGAFYGHTVRIWVYGLVFRSKLVWTVLSEQLAGSATLLWMRKGCLKVEEGLEDFKAIFTSKLSDAKSALCRWRANTPINSKPEAEDNLTVPSNRYNTEKLYYPYKLTKCTNQVLMKDFWITFK